MQSKITFTLKEEHIKLIERLNFKVYADTEYDDPFIPGIDRKRPFGNSGVVYDVMQILGYEPDEEGDYKEEDTNKAEDLLVELPLALKVVVTNRTFQPGVYEVDRHGTYFQYKLMRNYKALKGALKEAEETLGGAECAPGRLEHLRQICMDISGDDPWKAIQYIEWGKGKDPFWDSALEIFLKHKAMD